MRVSELYKVLNETISIRIVDNDNGEIFMTGLPFFIPVGIMDCRVVSIELAPANSFYDIEIQISPR